MAEISFYTICCIFSQIFANFYKSYEHAMMWDFDKIFQNGKNLANNEEN